MPDQFSHCNYCGSAYAVGQPWPRSCAVCGHVVYRNPLPVAVLILPVGRGLLAVRRAIEPGYGKLALPGGYINYGESWQQAAARELDEETGIRINPEGIELFGVHSAADSTLLIFGRAKRIAARDLLEFRPTDETSERVILSGPQSLAFDLHERIVTKFFARRRRHQ
jgi:ADP-ribose pyrophosphatase YjhB (NUDIX family)